MNALQRTVTLYIRYDLFPFWFVTTSWRPVKNIVSFLCNPRLHYHRWHSFKQGYPELEWSMLKPFILQKTTEKNSQDLKGTRSGPSIIPDFNTKAANNVNWPTIPETQFSCQNTSTRKNFISGSCMMTRDCRVPTSRAPGIHKIACKVTVSKHQSASFKVHRFFSNSNPGGKDATHRMWKKTWRAFDRNNQKTPWHRLVARIEGTNIADDQAIQAVHRHEPLEIREAYAIGDNPHYSYKNPDLLNGKSWDLQCSSSTVELSKTCLIRFESIHLDVHLAYSKISIWDTDHSQVLRDDVRVRQDQTAHLARKLPGALLRLDALHCQGSRFI